MMHFISSEEQSDRKIVRMHRVFGLSNTPMNQDQKQRSPVLLQGLHLLLHPLLQQAMR